jgi:hypothetical protein
MNKKENFYINLRTSKNTQINEEEYKEINHRNIFSHIAIKYMDTYPTELTTCKVIQTSININFISSLNTSPTTPKPLSHKHDRHYTGIEYY